MPEHDQIRVDGHLNREWSAWFDGLTLIHDPDGYITLAGPVADQAARYGLRGKARNLGYSLFVLGTPSFASCRSYWNRLGFWL